MSEHNTVIRPHAIYKEQKTTDRWRSFAVFRTCSALHSNKSFENFNDHCNDGGNLRGRTIIIK